MYVILKVCERDSPEGIREIEVYSHLKLIKTHHAGAMLVRSGLDSF